MVEIIPAILPKSFSELEKTLDQISGAADTVQIDVCDGIFARPRTWPIDDEEGVFSRIISEKIAFPHWKDFDFEAHLMVAHPAGMIEQWVKAGATRIFAHLEAISGDALRECIAEWGTVVEIGVALKLETSLDGLSPFAHELRTAQLMGIRNLGAQGQLFDTETIERVRHLHTKYPRLAIEVDGGITLDNAKLILEAGATRLVVGSAIVRSPDPRAAIAQFKNLLY